MLALATGVVSGSYPALYLSSLRPLAVLRPAALLLPVDVLTQLNYGEMLGVDIWENFLAWRNSVQNVDSTPVVRWAFGPNVQLEILLGDATHIKLTEGDRPEDLAPLMGIIGRIRLRSEIRGRRQYTSCQDP